MNDPTIIWREKTDAYEAIASRLSDVAVHFVVVAKGPHTGQLRYQSVAVTSDVLQDEQARAAVVNEVLRLLAQADEQAATATT